MKRQIISFVIIFFIVFSVFPITSFAMPENDVRIFLNNEELTIPEEYGQPFIDDQSRTQIPLRAVAEGLGHEVAWDGNTWTVSIDEQITIKIGERVVNTPAGEVKMDTEAVIINGRTYVPLRFVVEALGYTIAYDWKGYHRIDIYNTSPVKQIGQEESKEKKYFTDNKELIQFFQKNFDEKQYEIDKLHVYFDRRDAHLGGDIVVYNFPAHTDIMGNYHQSYYDIEIRHFSTEGNKKTIQYLLSQMLDKETAEVIFKQLEQGFGNGDVTENTWLTYNGYEYQFIPMGVGVNLKIKY